MKKIKDLPTHERPREKLLEKGAETLSDQELLSIILGKGSRKNDVLSLARTLIKKIDETGIKIQAKDILDIDGIGAAKATTIAAAFEFARRRIKPEGLKIKFPTDVLPLIRHYGDRKQEHFLCISINGANEVMNIRVITIGLINKSQVHPREVFADVIAERASALIVAHNHPDGDLKPSTEDLSVTKRLKEAASILGINLLDHIIFNNKGYYSFIENDEL
ncbi:MAG TPA: DNA repair protein RadC [Candidatus Deferrimicrobium sp.]|nr:DNA repair protein RadC [Candidatus Kapabacteria bacterium]HLP59132.1 DNA repair protein RadC [Candidatus Deferrimicrobium sp.]